MPKPEQTPPPGDVTLRQRRHPGTAHWRTCVLWLAGGLLLCALALTAFWSINSAFAVYDDEGYALYSLKDFARDGALYTELYSQYGPFFFLYHTTVFSLFDLPWTLDAGRLVTLLHWLGAAAACGGITTLLTRSGILGLAGMATAFMLLKLTLREPNHPGSLCALLIAAGILLALLCLRGKRPRAAAFLLGIFGASLLLVKINVGLFFLMAGFIALLLGARRFAGQQVLLLFCLVASLALPWVLMHTLLQQAWVWTYALNFSLAAVCAALCLYPKKETAAQGHAPSTWVVFASAATLCLTLVCAYTWATGTRPMDLVEGIILGPLKHPGVLNIPFPWQTGTLAAGVLAGVWAVTLKLGKAPPGVIRILRIGVAFVPIFFLFEPGGISFSHWIFSYFPLVFIAYALPWTADDHSPGMRLVALVLLFQYLHAYPVAGTQVFWSVFLTAPLWLACLSKAMDAIGPLAQGRVGRTLAEAGVLTVCMAAILPFGLSSYKNYHNYPHLQLPGSTELRIHTLLGSTLRVMDANIRQHADPLFTMPGMMSLHLWSGVPPPTRRNATQWFSLLDSAAQETISEKLRTSPNALWVVADWHVDFLRHLDLFTETPLVKSLETDWSPAFHFRRFTFWTHPERKVLPWQSISAVAADGAGDARLTLTCLPFEGVGEAIIVVLESKGTSRWITLNAENTDIIAAPITSAGELLAEPRPMQWPLRLSVPTVLWLVTSALPPNPPINPHTHALVVDAEHTLLTEFIAIHALSPMPTLDWPQP